MAFDRPILKRLLTVLALVAVLFIGEVTAGKLWMNPLDPGLLTALMGWGIYTVSAGLFLLIVQRLKERGLTGWLRVILVVGLSLMLPVKLGLSSGSAVLLTAGITAVMVGLAVWSTGSSGRAVLPVLFLVLVALSPDWFGGSPAFLSGDFLRGAAGGLILAGTVWLGSRVIPPLEEGLWRRRGAAAGAVILIFFAASWLWTVPWDRGEFQPYFSGTVPRVRAPADGVGGLPNIILISVDTLRRDMVPPHAEEPFAREALDDLYRDSVRFERMFSTSDWTLPAHASLFTGLSPVDHGAVRALGSRIRANRPTYTQILNDLGYRTAAFTDGGFVSQKLGFGRGFDHVWEQQFESGDFLPGVVRLACPDCGNPDARTVSAWMGSEEKKYRYFSRNLERARAWIDRREDRARPFFLFLHTYQVHDYWDLYPKGTRRLARDHPRLHDAVAGEEWPTPRKLQKGMSLKPREYAGLKFERGPATDGRVQRLVNWVKRRRRARRALYRYEAEAVYEELVRFIDYLKQNGLYRDAYLVFVSDHGEGFNLDSGAWGHGSRQLHEILVRVPTWIKYPANQTADRSVADLYQISDVFPLLFHDMGLEPADSLLKPVGSGPPEGLFESGRSVVSGSSGARSTFPKLFVRSRCRKLIHDIETNQTKVETVEQKDCAPKARTDTDVLHQELRKRLRRLEKGPNPYENPHFTMDPELVDELEGLGYL